MTDPFKPRELPITRQSTAAYAASLPLSGEATDEQLLERLCRGEQLAFTQLVHRHSTRYYRLAYRFAGSRSEAEDIVQEAFLKLWKRPEAWQVEKKTRFTTWFYRVVVNLCLDYRRRKRPLALIEGYDYADDRASQEQVLVETQQQQRLEAQVSALPDRQRTALMLCFYEGLSNQEAAEIMGLRLKALQSLLIRAKASLKETLREGA